MPKKTIQYEIIRFVDQEIGDKDTRPTQATVTNGIFLSLRQSFFNFAVLPSATVLFLKLYSNVHWLMSEHNISPFQK